MHCIGLLNKKNEHFSGKILDGLFQKYGNWKTICLPACKNLLMNSRLGRGEILNTPGKYQNKMIVNANEFCELYSHFENLTCCLRFQKETIIDFCFSLLFSEFWWPNFFTVRPGFGLRTKRGMGGGKQGIA